MGVGPSKIKRLRKAGAHTSVIMAMSGHNTMAMFKRYNKIDLDDGREVMKKLEVYLSGNRKEEKNPMEKSRENLSCYLNAEALIEPLAYA